MPGVHGALLTLAVGGDASCEVTGVDSEATSRIEREGSFRDPATGLRVSGWYEK